MRRVADKRGWIRVAIEQHAGRLMIMSLGAGGWIWCLSMFDPMVTGEFLGGVAASAALIVAGYLAPVLKRLILSKDGFQLETHDRTDQDENRTAAVEMTTADQPVEIENEADDVIEAARFMTAQLALQGILNPSVFHGCDLFIYLLDSVDGHLRPFYGTRDNVGDQKPWKPGVGAVGKAYLHTEFVLAAGPEAQDDTHGLDVDQQREHAGLRAVAAAPIITLTGETIGVVSASERTAHSELFLTTQDAQELLTESALLCARVLIDLLGLFIDVADEDLQPA